MGQYASFATTLYCVSIVKLNIQLQLIQPQHTVLKSCRITHQDKERIKHGTYDARLLSQEVTLDKK